VTVAGTAGVTIDAFLGGRVEAVQPAIGHHRSGLEAVLLGAALDLSTTGTVIDLGAGAGVAGMCAAARCRGIEVTLVERERELVKCARGALGRSANASFAGRISMAELDIGAPEETRLDAGLAREAADVVLVNPPFHDADAVRVSPFAARAAAHVLDTDLGDWFRAASWALAPKGTVVAIVRASSIGAILEALSGRFGGVCLLPLHPRPGLPAERLLIRSVKGSRAAPQILPGLSLHGDNGPAFTPALDRVLRHGAGIGEIHAPWQGAAANPL
jgi:tRNA1(Val) A37 N6-methylase TrmN6